MRAVPEDSVRVRRALTERNPWRNRSYSLSNHSGSELKSLALTKPSSELKLLPLRLRHRRSSRSALTLRRAHCQDEADAPLGVSLISWFKAPTCAYHRRRDHLKSPPRIIETDFRDQYTIVVCGREGKNVPRRQRAAEHVFAFATIGLDIGDRGLQKSEKQFPARLQSFDTYAPVGLIPFIAVSTWASRDRVASKRRGPATGAHQPDEFFTGQDRRFQQS